ncbi:MAG: response regulator transcription factor [Candidatus Obscuribacterales bacterium]|nr:response regulator transcription factor [Candidatus Obscuribacterales bacterium]
MARVLVVEDNPEVAATVKDWLIAENHSVDLAVDGEEALYYLKVAQYDVVILDWELPKIQGPDVCKQYRARGGKTPVLMLTGRRETADRISGLDSGCDDYLGKPFDVGELSARIRALLRRPPVVIDNRLVVGRLLMETDKKRVFLDGKEIYLLPKELQVLEFFMRHPGEVLNAETIVSRVWPSDSESTPDVVKVHISRLRKRLDTGAGESMFRTVHGLGYKLEA